MLYTWARFYASAVSQRFLANFFLDNFNLHSIQWKKWDGLSRGSGEIISKQLNQCKGRFWNVAQSAWAYLFIESAGSTTEAMAFLMWVLICKLKLWGVLSKYLIRFRHSKFLDFWFKCFIFENPKPKKNEP